jgi:hypothetical protein
MPAKAHDRRTVVAVMQPYFASYAGYYRLLAAADIFVIFDCVQFPRRGWVHRNRLPDAKGEAAWLTLPLSPAPYEASIADLVFASDAEASMAERLRVFPSMTSPPAPAEEFLRAASFQGPLVDYLEAQIRVACRLLGLSPQLLRSSALPTPPELRAQDRILDIVRRVGGTDYVNAPGGVDLYDAATFAASGVNLHFLPPHEGSNWSLLHRLTVEPVEALGEEVRLQTANAFRPGNPRRSA